MFSKSTISSVLSDITDKIGKLRDLAEQHHNLAQVHLLEVTKHEDLATEHAADRDRATRIAGNFETLLK